MARPKKENADYFSHDNDMRNDERILAVRRTFKIVGYGVWCMLLEKLCKADYFKIKYDDMNIEFLSGDFDIEPEKLKEVIDYCIKILLVQTDGDYIWCQKLIDRFQGMFEKRDREKEKVKTAVRGSDGKFKTKTPGVTDNNIQIDREKGVSDEFKPQSKVKYSKVNKSIVNKSKEIVSKDTNTTYGDPDINSILDLIKNYNNGIIDGTVKEQKQYGKHLVTKLKKIDSVKDGKYTSAEILEMILKIISKNEYHSHKIVGPKKIYYELAGLMQVCKQEFGKETKTNIPFIPGI